MILALYCRGLERATGSGTVLSLRFLLPASDSPSRSFSTSLRNPSHIGRTPLSIPPEVKFNYIAPPPPRRGSDFTIARPKVEVEGPLGKLSLSVPTFINVNYNEKARKVSISVQKKQIKQQRAMWGTFRAYLNNHILGVSEGHSAILRLVGVGYRASIESIAETATTIQAAFEGQKFVSLRVGYSHPIELPLPKGVNASVPQPTRILLEGSDKEIVSQLAADIRKWRRPEPYKGKGIFVNDETIRLKQKKGK